MYWIRYRIGYLFARDIKLKFSRSTVKFTPFTNTLFLAMAPVAARRLLLLHHIMSQQCRKAVVQGWILQNKGNEAIFS